MRRPTLIALLAALMVMAMTLGASAAIAGEVKGPPGPDGAEGGATPVASHTAHSICSFSGLNDVIDEMEPTQTQSYGTFLVLIKKAYGMEAAKAMLPSPGMACNPNSDFGH
ncbi:MAG: hypothetical protein ABFR89_10150 [Actinomycetota bacterium]